MIAYLTGSGFYEYEGFAPQVIETPFGVDFANGVNPEPTPVETLNANLQLAKLAFTQLIETLQEPSDGFTFQNFAYRF